MSPLDSLFKFPILMIDGTMEEKKATLGLDSDGQVDLIQGYAECPFHDFVSVTDRWVPTPESFENAQQGKFNHCFVVFLHSGQFIVPWTRDKFKKKYTDFVNSIEPPTLEVSIEEMKKLIEKEEQMKDERE